MRGKTLIPISATMCLRRNTVQGLAILLLLPLLPGCVPQVSPLQSAPSVPQRAVPASTAIPSATFSGTPMQGAVLRGRTDPDVQLLLDGKPVPVATDGRFLIGFDRDAPATATLVLRRAGQADVVRPLAVAPGNWDIQNIDAPITGSATTEAFKQLRGPELERIAAARAAMTPGSSMGWLQAFHWPISARISGRFGSQRIYRGTPGSFHNGVDLAAPAGTAYVAPADGVVILAADAPFTLEGNLLMIDHGMGLSSAFLHSQKLLVKVGDVVRQGQPIGIVGATGRATGPHLHWGMRWHEVRVDPTTLVSAAP